MTHQTENLIRQVSYPIELRAAEDPGRFAGVLGGYFARFNEWTEIRSTWEGNFMERLLPGAFRNAFADTSRIKVLYDHGHDPAIGNKPLGPIRHVEEDEIGARYEVDLIDTDYNRNFVIPAATEPDLLGASFRFSADDEDWDEKPERSEHNPKGLPERSISSVSLFEFGPVTFPAYAGATASMRSGSDDFLMRLASESLFYETLRERTSGDVAKTILTEAQTLIGQNATVANDEGDHRSNVTTQTGRSAAAARLALINLRR